MTPRDANRRYLLRFFPAMTLPAMTLPAVTLPAVTLPAVTLYVVFLLAANLVDARCHPHGAPLVALAVLPALPILAVIWAMGMAVVEQPDEYVRRNLVHAMLIATALMLAVTTVWSFLEDAGAVPAKPVHLVFPLWCLGLLIAQAWLSLRERIARQDRS